MYELQIGVAILVNIAGINIAKIIFISSLSLKQLQNIKNLCFHTQYVATQNNAILEIDVAHAAHSIHQPNPKINIGSNTTFTQPAISVGIILILASQTQRKTHVPAIHNIRNGTANNTI
jgi:hypothetical protein